MGCTGSKNTKAAAAAADAQPGCKTLLEGQAPAEKQPEPAASVAAAAQPEPAADAAAAAQPEVVAAPESEAAALAEAAPEEAAKIAAPAASEAAPATSDAQEAVVDAPLPAVAEQTEEVKEAIDAPAAASNPEVPKAEAVETTEAAIAVQTASEETTTKQAIEPKSFVFPFNFNICCGPQPVNADDSIPEPQELRSDSGAEVTASE